RTNNFNFTILEDGSLYTTHAISLPSNENTIYIFLKSNHEHEPKKIHVHLAKARHVRGTVLSRTKRRWLPVPTLIMENSLGPFPMQIQQLSSDTAQNFDIRYSISGPGADKPPLNVFYIEEETGNLFVTCPIDRETYPEFQLICYATTTDGYTPEVPLVHIIKIEDDNDNPPVFDQDIYTFCVFENSRVGTSVGQVIATDIDEPNTLHTKLKYRIVYQNPQIYQNFKPFAVHPDTGSITVASAHLNREEISEYKLHIEARDMGGQQFGLCNTAEVIIEIKDVNDNAPQLAQTVYEVQILENTENVEILCLPVRDDDEPGTPSWLAEFTITKGNEDNAFDVIIDREKNVGCIVLLKVLRVLEITVNNEVPYVLAPNSKALSMSTTKIVVHIIDEDEGPLFEPPIYFLNIKECLPSGTLVGNYQARDPETGSTSGIRYTFVLFVDFILMTILGDLRTATTLDRESLSAEYTQCKVIVKATDLSGKTGTGEILITVIDENDNYPVVPIRDYIMCNDKKPICIEAFDADLSPHAAPFHFEIEREDIEYGYYPIHLRIYDNEGNSGINEIIVHFCNCVIPIDCEEHNINSTVDRAPSEIPVDTDIAGVVLGSLMTVGKFMFVSTFVNATMSLNPLAPKPGTNKSMEEIKVKGQHLTEISKGGGIASKPRMYKSLEEIKGNGQCLPHAQVHVLTYCFLSEQKVFLCEQADEKKHVEEYIHSYHYEGKGSPVGSLSACACESDEEELSFLNNLDPPFKTLVEVFVKK
uniref:Cadherin domain-containing protein n=1 Tax=Salvator merianae TaxID=96440 RepID=A0A8D0C6F7_SALMN